MDSKRAKAEIKARDKEVREKREVELASMIGSDCMPNRKDKGTGLKGARSAKHLDPI